MTDPVKAFHDLFIILLILSSAFGLLCGVKLGEAEAAKDKKSAILWITIFIMTMLTVLFLGG